LEDSLDNDLLVTDYDSLMFLARLGTKKGFIDRDLAPWIHVNVSRFGTQIRRSRGGSPGFRVSRKKALRRLAEFEITRAPLRALASPSSILRVPTQDP
jgi:hypothetical protein